MSFETSAVRAALEAYAAGRETAERLVAIVAEAYYRDGKPESRGTREALRPLLDVIERAAPGRVELSRAEGKPGFELRTAARAFPRDREGELRAAVEQLLRGSGLGVRGSGEASIGIVARIRIVLRRLLG
ncbi:MAG TPA: hypothetical protein VGA20_00820 [Gemmatimonadales bacterium]